MNKPALLVLEDGSAFEGIAAGAPGEVVAEIVFNTSMTGYQEILTDPSYAGQVVTFTNPHIGNYGVNTQDHESTKIQAAGFVARELCEMPSNFRSSESFSTWTSRHGVVGITDVDTRALTRVLRDAGVMMGAIAHDATVADLARVKALIATADRYDDRDFVSEVATSEPFIAHFTDGIFEPRAVAQKASRPRVAVLDFGVKHSILQSLVARDFEVVVVPPDTPLETLRSLGVDGVLVSNGPGDPSQLGERLDAIRAIATGLPTFGICLGHQLLAAAFGAKTYKLPFGHRGPNQPVHDLDHDKVIITSQNHGYAVVESSMPDCLRVSQRNLNDDTIEGFAHKTLPIRAVQYHPEAGPGPNDAQSFFDDFADALNN